MRKTKNHVRRINFIVYTVTRGRSMIVVLSWGVYSVFNHEGKQVEGRGGWRQNEIVDSKGRLCIVAYSPGLSKTVRSSIRCVARPTFGHDRARRIC
jgi:hypothetical protein